MRRQRRGPLAPDPEMWRAFEGGPGLRRVLEDFYERVFHDERLAPFFEGTNKDWVIGKQYAFLRSIFTGESCYFGLRPRNAHHWMIISDELFDYRESLMEDCLERYGLAEPLRRRFRALDEVYRKQIVKRAPRPLVMKGVVRPAEGWDAMTLTIGTLCDDCGEALDPGVQIVFHLRTGRVRCGACRAADLVPAAADAIR